MPFFLHGGPGISLHALFRYFHKDLERHFVVVGWDQRGAGKSYSKLLLPESINISTYISETEFFDTEKCKLLLMELK